MAKNAIISSINASATMGFEIRLLSLLMTAEPRASPTRKASSTKAKE